MHTSNGRRQSLRKSDGPWKVADLSVVISNQETPDSTNRVTDRERRSSSRENGEQWQPFDANYD
jgi:hypothetical protein